MTRPRSLELMQWRDQGRREWRCSEQMQRLRERETGVSGTPRSLTGAWGRGWWQHIRWEATPTRTSLPHLAAKPIKWESSGPELIGDS